MILPTFEFRVGVLKRRKIREFLEREKWSGTDVRWREGKEFMTRTFLVAAPDDKFESLVLRINKLL